MELVKDIYFNTDKLVENTKVKVSYTGKFYQQDSNNKVYIHYGYGDNWNNLNESEMVKTDLGYQTEINLLNAKTLNCCFKTANNEWDNNSGKNYIFNIEPSILPNSEINNISGILEDTSLNTPNSVDTFIPNNVSTPVKTIPIVETPVTPVSQNENLTNVSNLKVSTAPINSLNSQSNTTALTVLNNRFPRTAVWARKFKFNIRKFISYVPKVISGNYKRNIENKQ